MSLASMLCHPVTIIRPGARTDRYGQNAPDWTTSTSRTTVGWFHQRSSIERNEGRDTIINASGLFLHPDETIDAYDRVEVFGQLYDVDGVPTVARTPRGPHHLEVSLTEVDG